MQNLSLAFKAVSSKYRIKLCLIPKKLLMEIKKRETSLFCCRIELDFNGYYTSFPKEEKTLNHEAVKPHFQNQNYESIS